MQQQQLAYFGPTTYIQAPESARPLHTPIEVPVELLTDPGILSQPPLLGKRRR